MAREEDKPKEQTGEKPAETESAAKPAKIRKTTAKTAGTTAKKTAAKTTAKKTAAKKRTTGTKTAKTVSKAAKTAPKTAKIGSRAAKTDAKAEKPEAEAKEEPEGKGPEKDSLEKKEIDIHEDDLGHLQGDQVERVEVIAKLFGLSVRRIQQLTQDGVLETSEVLDGKRAVRRYNLVQTTQRYIAYLQDKANGKSGESQREKELKERKLEAEANLKESQTELHRLKTKIAVGEYVSKEQVKLDYSRFFVAFKNMALSLPAICSGRISAYVEPVEARKVEKELTDDISRQLSAFVAAGVGPDDVKESKRGTTRKKATAKAQKGAD